MQKWGAVLVAITVASVQASRLPGCRRDACTTISENRDTTRIRDRVPHDLIVVVFSSMLRHVTEAHDRLLTATPVQRVSLPLLHFYFWRMAGWKTYPTASWHLADSAWRFLKNRFYFCARRTSRRTAGAR
jgi:hypothetical protein